MTSPAQVVAPQADLIDGLSTTATDIESLLIIVAGAVLGWFIVSQLFKAKTATSAAVALIIGCVLFWLLGQVDSGTIDDPLDDTVDERLGIGTAPLEPGSGT